MSRDRLPAGFIAASIFSGMIQPLISLIDTYFAAHISTQDLACLTLGGGVAAAVGWVGGQTIGGFPGVLGRLRGRDDDAGARLLSGEVLALAFIAGLIVMTPLALGLGEALAAITESEATGDGAAHYLQVRMLGFPFEVCSFVVLGILRAGYRAVWTPLMVMLVALTANAGLNALFVWGFGWGLTGIALASACAPALAVGCAAVPISRWGGWAIGAGIKAVRHLKLAPMTMLSLQLGSIAVWRGILLNGVLIGSSVVAERFSTNALAAHGLALQIWLLIAFAIDGFSHAGLAYGSRLLGAGEFDRARAFAWRLIGASFGLCAIICGLLVAVWSALPASFGLDAIAAAAFTALLAPLCFQVLPSSVAFVADGILKGAGDIAFLARQMLLASAIVFPLALFFLGDSLTGLWWAVTLWLVARATLSALRLAGSRWQKIAAEQLE